MHQPAKYVQVYNKILKMIEQGQLVSGEKLPSEEILTKEFDVSRVTLRTALSLLKEDGFITSIHGKGHYISNTSSFNNQQLETFVSPILTTLTTTIDSRETYYHKNASSAFTDQLFGVKNHPYLTLNIWYRSGENNVANNLAIVMPETIEKFTVDLNNSKSIVKFLENDVYNVASSSTLTLAVSERHPSTFRRKFINDSPLMLITEDIFDIHGDRLIQNKYYIPSTLFRAEMVRHPTDLP
ncbi:winged helix-turn-helix domain-containing protein [Pediococcus acidilactici]